MSTVQPSKTVKITNRTSENLDDALTRLNYFLDNVKNNGQIRYEFVLKVQARDIICTLHKTMFAPLLPMTCDNITIDTGYYSIHRSMVDMDEKIVHIWLTPIIVHRVNGDREIEAFEQVIKELKESRWYE